MKALIVDDSPITRRVLSLVLASHRIQAIVAENGRQGLEILGQEPEVGLIMVDWYMPEMSGIDFVRTVRGRQGHRDTKIFMVTASDIAEGMRRAKEIGADDFLIKPISGALIANKLRDHGFN